MNAWKNTLLPKFLEEYSPDDITLAKMIQSLSRAGMEASAEDKALYESARYH